MEIGCQPGPVWLGMVPLGAVPRQWPHRSRSRVICDQWSIGFASGSMVDGELIVTTGSDQDSLAALQCLTGETVKYDPVLGWACGSDQDTSDWNALQNVPADLADGDDTLSETEVEHYVWNAAVDLPSEQRTWGPISSPLRLPEFDMITYNAQTSLFDCQPFTSLLDMDGDGAWVRWIVMMPIPMSVIKYRSDCDGFCFRGL